MTSQNIDIVNKYFFDCLFIFNFESGNVGSTDSKMWRETFERLRTKIRRDPSGSQRVYRRKIFTETDRKRGNRQRTFWTSIRGTLTGTSDHRGRFSRERFSSPGFCPGFLGNLSAPGGTIGDLPIL